MRTAGPGPVSFPAGSVLLAGATACGKSAVAMDLAARLGAAIVSVDSMQVYRGMDIGTGKPTPAERARVPHYLIDLVDVAEPFDAARFLDAARGVMDRLIRRGQPALCVGGTGLYFNVLLGGLSAEAAPDPILRAELEGTPLPALVAALAAEDPAASARVDRANPRRVIRALERARARAAASAEEAIGWRARTEPLPVPIVALRREREDLRQRIRARVEAMFAQGLVDETRRLLAQGLEGNRTALQALGYRQVVEHLHGQRSLAETMMRVQHKTWQYARRQQTWFARQLAVRWLDVSAAESPGDTARRILEEQHL